MLQQFYITIGMDLLIAFTFGSTIASSSTSIIQLYAEKSPHKFDPRNSVIVSLLATSHIFGCFIGAFIAPSFAKKLGTKNTIMYLLGFFFISFMLALIPVSWVYFFVMRFFIGVFCQMAVTLAPPWFVEISENENKSFLNQFFEIFIAIGILIQDALLLIIGDKANRYFVNYLFGLAVSIGGAILINFVKTKQAPICAMPQDIIITSDQEPNQQDFLTSDVYQQQQNTQVLKQTKNLESIFSPKLRLCLINAILLGVNSQGNGIAVFTLYITFVFEKIFVGVNPYLSSAYGSLIMCVFKVTGCIIPLFCLKKLKRKTMYFGGNFTTAIANLIMSTAYAFGSDSNARMWLIILATIIFMLGFEFGPGTMSYIVVGEIFPRDYQSQLSGVMFISMSATNITIMLTFYFFKNVQWLAYLIYAIFTVVTNLIMMKTVPESKGKTNQQIEKEVFKQ